MVKTSLKPLLTRAAMAVLLFSGLMAALLAMLGQLSQLPVSMLTGIAVIAVPAACSLNRLSKRICYAVIAAAPLIWLAAGGSYTLSQLWMAAVLHFSGQTAVIHMYGRGLAIIASVLFGLFAWMCSARNVCYLSIAFVILAGIGLWLTGHETQFWYLAPALISSLMLIIRFRHQDISLRRVFPMLSVLVLAACFVTPLTGVAIAPLKEKADDLRQTIMEYLFYTEPRNVFSLSAEGYYPEGLTQLGGKAEPSDRDVMLVTSARKVYLRGSVKNEYTGRIWRDTTGGRRYLWIDPRWTDRRQETFDMSLPAGRLGADNSLLKEQTVTVQILADNASSMFVPQRVRTLSPGGELVPYFNNASEIFATRDLKAGDLYTVSAPLAIAGDAGLSTIIEACAKNDDPAYASIAAAYTVLPDHLQQMVFDLAREITATAETPYDKAFAIQNYLSRSYRYTLDVDPQPADIDFVTNFLFSTKEGYCTYFASAMTVLCRMIGLPSRYVEGYLAVPDEQGQAHVKGYDGHAWTEVYFSGYGWLTFDATPSQEREAPPPDGQDQQDDQNDPDDTPEDDTPPEDTPEPENDSEPSPPPENETDPDEEPSPSPEPSPEPSDEPDPQSDQDDPDQNDPPDLNWLWWLLLVLAAAAAIVWRVLWCMPSNRARRTADRTERITVWTQAVYDALYVQKIKPMPAETPLAFFRRVDASEPLEITLLPLGRELALTYYGKAEPTDEALYLAEETWKALLKQMQFEEKLKTLFRLAFVPMKKRTMLRK